jgi:signal transduction histidine kinase
VHVSTTSEAEQAETLGEPSDEVLALQVTRDRLEDNEAYQQLRVLVRAGLDLYAMELARTRIIKARRRRGPPDSRGASESFTFVREAVEQVKDRIPATTYRDIRGAVTAAVDAAAALEESSRAHASVLGALATAGMTSLAYEHEVDKQLASLDALREDLLAVLPQLNGRPHEVVETATVDIESWILRARGIRAIFSPLMSEETRTSTKRFGARSLAEDVARQLRALARSTEIETKAIPKTLRLPMGGYPAWSAIFQNLYVNAFNAVLDESDQLVRVDGGGDDRNGWVRVQDTGVGIDTDDSERLFLPFERGMPASRERESLALGGTGLGLTIVRMITDELGCVARFTTPDEGFASAVTVSWKGAQ